jgi:hypothetical protein
MTLAEIGAGHGFHRQVILDPEDDIPIFNELMMTQD